MPNAKSHYISLADACAMTARYRELRPGNYPICESFEMAAVINLLSQPGAAFLRIYYGIKEDGLMDAILVAADADGADILPVQNPGANRRLPGDGDEGLLEDSYRCPTTCPPDSPLNGG